jgi:hypothetical protein
MHGLNSFATSELKKVGFPEASRSIATNAFNLYRHENARENFANTATSARGKKRTHGLVFYNDKKNEHGRYKRYTRSHRYAEKNANNSSGGVGTYKENPSTREKNAVMLARYSNATRKALFERAVKDKNVKEIARLLDARYAPSRQLAVDAIRAMVCLQHGLAGVQRILNLGIRFYVNEVNDMYAAVMTCSRDRAEDLVKAFMKANVIPSSVLENSILIDVIDWGLEKGCNCCRIIYSIPRVYFQKYFSLALHR